MAVFRFYANRRISFSALTRGIFTKFIFQKVPFHLFGADMSRCLLIVMQKGLCKYEINFNDQAVYVLTRAVNKTTIQNTLAIYPAD